MVSGEGAEWVKMIEGVQTDVRGPGVLNRLLEMTDWAEKVGGQLEWMTAERFDRISPLELLGERGGVFSVWDAAKFSDGSFSSASYLRAVMGGGSWSLVPATRFGDSVEALIATNISIHGAPYFQERSLRGYWRRLQSGVQGRNIYNPAYHATFQYRVEGLGLNAMGPNQVAGEGEVLSSVWQPTHYRTVAIGRRSNLINRMTDRFFGRTRTLNSIDGNPRWHVWGPWKRMPRLP